jgi:CHAD domain-containing protein
MDLSKKSPDLLSSLFDHWVDYRACLSSCRKNPKTGSIHNLRVKIRKLVAIFDLIGEPAVSIKKKLKKELKIVGRLRDLQNQEKTLGALLGKGEMPEFYSYLKEKRRHEQRGVKRKLSHTHPKRQDDFVFHLENLPNKELLLLSLTRILKDLETTVKKSDLSDSKAIHHIRIALKNFRYAREALSFAYPASHQAETEIKRFQNYFGDFQDTVVRIELLYEFIRKRYSSEIH